MKIYKHIARNIHFPITQLIKGEKVGKYLNQLEESQYFSKEQLEDLQIQKLQNLLVYVNENSLYYKNLFEKELINPKEITSFEQFQKIPFLTKEIITTQQNNLTTQNYQGKIYQCTTSGSTGKTLNFTVTSEYSSWDWASRWRARRWFDVNIGDKEMAIWGRPVYNKLSRFFDPVKAIFRNTILLDGFDVSEENLEKYSRILFRYKPEYIYGYSNSVFQLAKHIYDFHHQKTIPTIKAIFVTAEMLYPDQRDIVEKVFNAPVSNEYGCSEVGGFAFECKEGNWHISSENVIVESISIDENPPEFVLTSLTNFHMPFIRYRIGDLGELSNDKCTCEVNLPILKFNAGKTTDVIRLKNGRKLTSEIFLYLTRAMVENKLQPLKNFKIIQKEFDLFTILHENEINSESKKQFTQLFLNLLKENDIIIQFQQVEKLEKDKTGKFRYYISELKNEII